MRKISIYVFLICTGILFSKPQVSAQSQGPLNPGTRINDASGGAVAWVSPNNSAASDNTYAVATNGITNFLSVSNFGFSIPPTANITGIQLDIEKKAAPVNPVASGTWTTFTPPAYTSGTATTLYGGTSYSYNLPVSSATNNQRLLVVTVGIENVDNIAPTNPAVTFGTATYNGVAMTLAASNSMASATTSNNVAVYYMVESNLPSTTGSRSLVINKTINGELSGGTISPAEYVEVVGVNVYTNVNQSTPVTAVSQTSSSSPITSPLITNVRNGDYLMAATMNNTSSGANVTHGTGFTEHFEIAHNNGGTTSGAILEVQSKSLASIVGAPIVTISATASGASRLVMGALAINAARVYDRMTTLTDATGIPVGNNKAIVPANILGNAWSDDDTYQTYGGAGDLWGTTWTPAIINNSGFGMDLQADALNSIASIDHIRITVYYSVPLGMNEEIIMSETSTQTISGNETKVSIYPNPVTEYFIVESVEKINSLSITDAAGKEVAIKVTASDEHSAKVEQMPTKGFYHLIIQTSTGIISKKIIIN